MTRPELEAALNIEESFIPPGRKNRPGTVNTPQFLTIHNTDNTNAGADARAHGRFLNNTGHYILNNKPHWVSWHYTVDDKRVVQHLPLAEKAFHAVNANTQSIGIELCMHQGIDQEKAFLNAARLCTILLLDFSALNKDVNKIVPHKFWTGKNCPRLLLDNGSVVGNKWRNFLNTVQQELDNVIDVNTDILSDLDIESARNYGKDVINEHVTGDFHLDTEEDQEQE